MFPVFSSLGDGLTYPQKFPDLEMGINNEERQVLGSFCHDSEWYWLHYYPQCYFILFLFLFGEGGEWGLAIFAQLRFGLPKIWID